MRWSFKKHSPPYGEAWEALRTTKEGICGGPGPLHHPHEKKGRWLPLAEWLAFDFQSREHCIAWGRVGGDKHREPCCAKSWDNAQKKIEKLSHDISLTSSQRANNNNKEICRFAIDRGIEKRESSQTRDSLLSTMQRYLQLKEGTNHLYSVCLPLAVVIMRHQLRCWSSAP